jgi:hypothetical protein
LGQEDVEYGDASLEFVSDIMYKNTIL